MIDKQAHTVRPQPAEWRKGVAAAAQARRLYADDAAQILIPSIRDVQAGGANSLRAIADALNARGVRTVRGTDWTPMAVRRVLMRVAG